MRWARNLARVGDRILVERPLGNWPFKRPRLRWEDNIETGLQEMGKGAWNGLIWLRIWTGDGHL